MSTLTTTLIRWPKRQPLVFLLIAAALWWGLYQLLIPFSEAIVAALPVDRASHLGSALQFFFYDTPKVLLLLTGVVVDHLGFIASSAASALHHVSAATASQRLLSMIPNSPLIPAAASRLNPASSDPSAGPWRIEANTMPGRRTSPAKR